MFILGDMELNLGDAQIDNIRKNALASLPMTFLCIHGNHEIRPCHVESYRKISSFGNTAYMEDKFPNILFLDDGLKYHVFGMEFLVIGGAFSVTRLLEDHKDDLFCDDEQPSPKAKEQVDQLCAHNPTVDYILTHTCPFNYIPYDACTIPLDRSLIDTSTERWMQKVHERMRFHRWFCGHYHTNRTIVNLTFIYRRVIVCE